MSVSLDAINGSMCTGWSGSNLTLNNFTCAADATDLYVLLVFAATNTTGIGISSLTYNGVALFTIVSAITTNEWFIVLARLKNPASGSHALACATTGTFQHVAVGAWTFKGQDPTTPEHDHNSASGDLSGGDDTFPDISVPILRADYGFTCGGISYVSSFDGPPDSSHPYNTVGFNNGHFVNSSGITSPGQILFMNYGPPDGASDDISYIANQSAAYSFTVAGASLNAAPVSPIHPPFFSATSGDDLLRALSSCDHN